MIKVISRVAAVAMLASLPVSASALTFTVLNSSSNYTNNTANVFAADYGAYLAPGASWVSGAVPDTIQPPPLNQSSVYRSPWSHTTPPTPQANNSFFVVQPISQGTGFPATPDPAKMIVGGIQTMFTFLWGSIDIENTVEFRLAGVNVGTVTGTQVATSGTGIGGLLAGCEDATSTSAQSKNSFGCVAKVAFKVAGGFDQIWFGSGTGPLNPQGRRNSMEFATVPLPAAAWLLLGVTGALVAAKRRSARRAA